MSFCTFSVGFIPLQHASNWTFSSESYSLLWLHCNYFKEIFPVLLLFTSLFAVFHALGYFIDPNFRHFHPWPTCSFASLVMGLFLRRSGLRTQLTLPPPQARNTLSIFLCNNNNRIRQSRIFQALRACQTSFRKMHNFS